MMQAISIPMRFAASPAPPPERGGDKDEAPGSKMDFWDRVTGVAGRVGHGIAKAPGVILRLVPGLVKFAVVDAIVPAVQFTAALGGVVAFVGVGASGIIEMVSGARQRDAVKVLSGAGELSRGLFLGTVADAAVSRMPFDASTLGTAGRCFSYATGVFAIGAGAAKCWYGNTADRPHQYMEGILEMGIGLCSIAATQGTLLYPAIAAQAALALTRVVVVQKDQLRTLGKRTAERVRQSWNNLRDVVRRAFSRDDAPSSGATSGNAESVGTPPDTHAPTG